MWGGKRAEILTVLVEPIKECESLFFRFKRYFEKKVIKRYNQRGNNNA
jgi:predicted HAD superfamily phosphohydrolase YqeG